MYDRQQEGLVPFLGELKDAGYYPAASIFLFFTEFKMATRSQILVRLEDGSTIGTYCHYDGYPGNMVPELFKLEPWQLKEAIKKGQTLGGFRTIHRGEIEYFKDLDDSVLNEIDPRGNWLDYGYIMEQDGSVAVFDANGDLRGVFDPEHQETRYILEERMFESQWPEWLESYGERMMETYTEKYNI